MFTNFSKRLFLLKSMFIVLICLSLASTANLQAFRFGPLGSILIAAANYCEQLQLTVKDVIARVPKVLPVAKPVSVTSRASTLPVAPATRYNLGGSVPATNLGAKTRCSSFEASDKR